uniref:C-type lectin domain-containing protein n=1 Tax=Esox lucius TaxID=8010 RepID=A0AAY5KM61_ESOLU
MATKTIFLLLVSAFILCELSPLAEANRDQLSASKPKPNSEHSPDMLEIKWDNANNTEKMKRLVLMQQLPSFYYGWFQHGSRYFRFINTAKTWAKSEHHCVQMGGNLASVHNSVEYLFIKALVLVQTGGFPVTWIGGYNLDEVSLWLWSDGSRFDFTNWAHKEPNSGFGNCLQINYGTENLWDDTHCKTRLPFVCSKRVV